MGFSFLDAAAGALLAHLFSVVTAARFRRSLAPLGVVFLETGGRMNLRWFLSGRVDHTLGVRRRLLTGPAAFILRTGHDVPPRCRATGENSAKGVPPAQ